MGKSHGWWQNVPVHIAPAGLYTVVVHIGIAKWPPRTGLWAFCLAGSNPPRWTRPLLWPSSLLHASLHQGWHLICIIYIYIYTIYYILYYISNIIYIILYIYINISTLDERYPISTHFKLHFFPTNQVSLFVGWIGESGAMTQFSKRQTHILLVAVKALSLAIWTY